MLAGLGRLAGTSPPVALYPSSGTGAWEAALRLGLKVEIVDGDWRRGVRPDQVADVLAADPARAGSLAVLSASGT
ncbi:MAG TPA: hypothetical protein VMU94_20385 [Streptosporangiaceae bacterium]|nr:hypothetical protein [Streptosporangiaceae bacterium]